MPDREREDPLAEQEASRAAAEAGAIGGHVSYEADPGGTGVGEAERPLMEAGEGEAEGFELAEQELIEHASHGDQHAARRAVADAPEESDDARAARDGETDREYSSEVEDDR